MNPNIKKSLKKIIPGMIMKQLKKRYRMFTMEDIEHATLAAKNNHHIDLLKKINLKRSIHDEMFNKNGPHYLLVGLSAISCIDEAVNKSGPKIIKRILDMPCGHGRVLRFLEKYFTGADITACDINRDGVDFCSKEFGASPAYSRVNLGEFDLNKKFDLIWCGSLATHLDDTDTFELLKFFYRHLVSGGLLVISMHGKRTVENLNTRKYTYGLSDDSIKELLLKTNKTGYGYVDYYGQSKYGISITTPEWMEAKLRDAGSWKNFTFSESAWIDHHDIYSVAKV